MRLLVLMLTLFCLAGSPALAQNGLGNGNGQGNGNGAGIGSGVIGGIGQGNGNGQGNAPGNPDSAIGGQVGAANDNGKAENIGDTVRHTQDYARDAVSAGKAVSLSSLLPDLEERATGEVIDAELLDVQGILVYAVKVLRPNGQVTQEYYYAQSGRFIGSEP